MKISPRCPACLLNRVYAEAKMSTDDEEKIKLAVGEALKILAEEYPKGEINALIATKVHRKVYQVLEDEDPYRGVKRRANQITLKHLAEIDRIVSESEDSFRAAAKAAIIANTFDYGVMGHEVNDTRFMDFFLEKFKESLRIDDLHEIRKLCRGDVVYLTDNCGEIIVDTLFMREIKEICKRLTVVVRGKPVISDATYEDAILAGIDKIADEILTNGDGIGIIDSELPDETRERLNNSDIIIAKGMANYECLSGWNGKIAFLLTAKCKPVAESIGVEVGDMVAMLRGDKHGA
jgi:hypothetical protein